MPPRHLLLALLTVFIWGTNFVFIKIALDVMPPLALALFRFALASLPLLFFVPRPKVAWRWLISTGVLIGAGQFGLLFIAIKSHIAPGLASLVVQMQVFFTIGLASLIFRERMRAAQIVGLVIASIGIATIAWHLDATVTPVGLALVLAAATCWALGNITTKCSSTRDMFEFTIWSSTFAVPPLLAMTLAFEGWPAIRAGVAHATWLTWLAVIWQALGNTVLGYGIWNWLLARHSAAAVTPMAMLVPVFGMSASSLVLGEPLQAWKLTAGAAVLGGIALAVLRIKPLARASSN